MLVLNGRGILSIQECQLLTPTLEMKGIHKIIREEECVKVFFLSTLHLNTQLASLVCNGTTSLLQSSSSREVVPFHTSEAKCIIRVPYGSQVHVVVER